jgi:hypothetical protein
VLSLSTLLLACAPDVDVLPTAELVCEHAIETVDAVPDGFAVVLDAVALDGTEGALATADSGEGDPASARFAKTGLLVAAGVASSIEVPADQRDAHSIGWGNSGSRTWALTVPACEGDGPWLAFPGGHHVREPGCYTLVVRSLGARAEVPVGVGSACR